MLLVESFEEATEMILEGIDSGDVSLILEASEKYTKALEKYRELIAAQRTIYEDGRFGELAKAVKKILDEIEDAIKSVEAEKGNKTPDFKANWSNLLKLTSPWDSGQKTSMADLSTQAAKLDILSRGLLECIVMVDSFCKKYKEVFTINEKGFMVNQDTEVNPEFTLASIAGKKGEELINALLKGGGGAEESDLFKTDSNEDGVSDEDNSESENQSDQVQDSYHPDGEVINEILGFGGGGSTEALELIAKNFDKTIDKMGESDWRKASKKLYDYFKGMADDAKDMSKEMLEKLSKLEPSKDLQKAVKGSGSSWLPKIFQKAEQYQLSKEQSQSLVDGLLGLPMSQFEPLVGNIRKGLQKAKPADTVAKTDDAAQTESQEAAKQAKEPDMQEKQKEAENYLDAMKMAMPGVDMDEVDLLTIQNSFLKSDSQDGDAMKDAIKNHFGGRALKKVDGEKMKDIIALMMDMGSDVPFKDRGKPKSKEEKEEPITDRQAGDLGSVAATKAKKEDDEKNRYNTAYDSAIDLWDEESSTTVRQYLQTKNRKDKLKTKIKGVTPEDNIGSGTEEEPQIPYSKETLGKTADEWKEETQKNLGLGSRGKYPQQSHKNLKKVLDATYDETSEVLEDPANDEGTEETGESKDYSDEYDRKIFDNKGKFVQKYMDYKNVKMDTDEELEHFDDVISIGRLKQLAKENKPTEQGTFNAEVFSDEKPENSDIDFSPRELAINIGIADTVKESNQMRRWLELAGILND